LTCPDGFTVMVNVLAGPSQERPLNVKVGVTVTTETIGEFVLFVDIKLTELPEPDVARPVAVFELVQR